MGLSLLYLLCHGLAIWLFPGHAKTLSFAFLMVCPLLAGLACLRRCRGSAAMDSWIALALGMLLWAGGMAVNMYQETVLVHAAVTPGASMFLYVLYGVPLTFALASPGNEAGHVRIVDGALAVVLGYLFLVHTFTFATMSDATEEGAVNLRLMFDIENAFIALFALVRYLASDDEARHDFFRALVIYAFTYLAVAGYINHFQDESFFGGYIDLLIDVPFLVLAIAVSRRKRPLVRPRVSRRLAHIVRAGSPLMLPLTLLVVSSLILHSNRGFAVAGFVVATLGYGLRSVLTQVRSFERQDQLGQLARVDPLTGLANRRQFDETLRQEWNRARRSGSGLALLMIDIDHFKQLNDTFGHPAGDACLREVAQVLAASAARSSEWLARYGGEEFVVVLPSSTLDDARAVAQAMRASVERLRLVAPEPGGVVTVSIGVGFQESIATDDPSVLVAAADAALYDAKHAGRNRVAHRA